MHRLLFVDDDPSVLACLQRLPKRRFEVSATTDPKEAVELVSDREFDVVISDFKMPVINGLEMLAKVKEDCPRALRVLLTGAPPKSTDGLAHLVIDKTDSNADLCELIARALE